MNPTIEKISRQFAASHYKLTPQREAIVQVLLENAKQQLSVEEVYMLVKSGHPHLGMATVYRTLELLSGLQLVDRLNVGDGMARYTWREDKQESMHPHLVCHICGKTEEVHEDWLIELEHQMEREYGFKVTDHRLDFKGTYNKCRNGCAKVQKDKSVS